jgi:hypothetical protein
MAENVIDEFLDWFLTNRHTGERTVVQRANAQLLTFYAAFALMVLTFFLYRPAMVVFLAVAVLALGWWGLMELLTGVNPFRRLAGVAGLCFATLLVLGQLRLWG